MKPEPSLLTYLMKPKNWWLPFLLIFAVSIAGLIFIGYQTHKEAPPIPDFVSELSQVIISKEDILAGQEVFHPYALMEYGSMFGDGAHDLAENHRRIGIPAGRSLAAHLDCAEKRHQSKTQTASCPESLL